MKIIKPSFMFMGDIDGNKIIKHIEKAGRVCYKSENNIGEDTAGEFIMKRIKTGHESILEHASISVKIICDRGISHEIVRHRLASYSQESTRYCNYGNDKFENECTFIEPFFWTSDEKNNENYEMWKKCMEMAEQTYLSLLEHGATPQQARCVLPNSLKTEIVVTMNLREWRHFFKLRTDLAAHPQMRQITLPMLNEFSNKIPYVFCDIVKDNLVTLSV